MVYFGSFQSSSVYFGLLWSTWFTPVCFGPIRSTLVYLIHFGLLFSIQSISVYLALLRSTWFTSVHFSLISPFRFTLVYCLSQSTLVHSVYICLLWSTWFTLVYFEPVGFTLVYLVRFGRLLSIRSTLVHFGPVQFTLIHSVYFGSIHSFQFGPFWSIWSTSVMLREERLV